MKKQQILACLFFISIMAAYSQIINIFGPVEVCPGIGSSPQTYTYTAFSSQPGCFAWSVFQNGQWESSDVLPCPCSSGSSSNPSTFNVAFNNQEGEAKVRVSFIPVGVLCISKPKHTTITVQKRVFGPGTPYDADGGQLTICPGETKTFYVPGVPGTPNSEDNCYWHHTWDWTAPAGWQINGGTNTFQTGQKSVSVTAPANAIVGGNYEFKVATEFGWPVYKEEIRQIQVGYSENVIPQGSDLVCNSNSIFTVQNLPANSWVSWTKSNNMSYVSGQNSNSYVVKAQSSSTSGSGWVQASLSGSCGSKAFPKTVWVGIPENIPSISYDLMLDFPSEICVSSASAYGDFYAGAVGTYSTHFEWQSDAGQVIYPISTDYGFTSVMFTNYGYRYVRVRPVNSCGPGEWTTKYFNLIYSQNCGGGGGIGGFSVATYPNPATDELNVEVYDEELICSGLSISITDMYNNRYDFGKRFEKRNTLNISGLKKGIYLMEISTEKGKRSTRIIKE